MKVFVAGATGVIGRRVVPALIALGHQVTGVTRRQSGIAEIQRHGATAVKVDLFNPRAVRDAIEDHDTVINLATRIPKTWRAFLPFAWRQNDRIREHVSANLVAAALSAGVDRYIQESFAPAYPDLGDEWIRENTPIEPASYSLSLVDAETSANRFGVRTKAGVILRFGLFYGPDDASTAMAINTVRKGWSPFPGEPSAYLAMISHDDAAAAVVAALAVPTGAYNVVDNEPVTRGQWATELARAMSAPPPRFLPKWTTRLAGPVAKTIARSVRIANGKLKAASKWTPSHPNSIEGWKALL